jgi:hypothetical protein
VRNISFVENSFVTISGCGAGRSGGAGCPHLCTNMSCVLSHVDPALAPEVHASGNSVVVASETQMTRS